MVPLLHLACPPRVVGHCLMKSQATPKQTRQRNAAAICCSSVGKPPWSFPSQASVFTASRLDASVIRILGPGSCFDTSGFGTILSLDEFFLCPLRQHDDTYQSETLTYFLEDRVKDDEIMDVEGGNELSRHGIQVCFQPSIAGTGTLENVSNVIEMSHVQKLFLESGNGKGGAEVRVIAGNFEHICSSNTYQEWILLDILMRPGSEAAIPLNESHGLIVYIMEGVGIFNRGGLVRSFYENEGHGIWFPPLFETDPGGSPLSVSSHLWSTLRFLVLASPL